MPSRVTLINRNTLICHITGGDNAPQLCSLGKLRC